METYPTIPVLTHVSVSPCPHPLAVAHEGTACPVAGISYGVTTVDIGEGTSEFTCDDMKTDLDDFTFDRVSGDDVRTGCRFWSGLSDVGGYCQSIGIGDAGNPESKMIVSVWNDGGCEGNLIFDAVLSDDPASEAAIASGEPASVCLSGFSQICEDVDGGNSTGTFDPDRVCGEEDISAATNLSAWYYGTSMLFSFIAAFFLMLVL